MTLFFDLRTSLGPIQLVVLCGSFTSQSAVELAQVLHYFENNYIGLVDPEDENCSRVIPKYPPSYWNLRKRIQKGLPRSNNSLKASRLGISLFRIMLNRIQIVMDITKKL
ncbi:hypothetical protein BpHYR1_048231 [Brachionus plicatilis]|uniref:Uncharacterized protein n=1 Tax=Brachionus plicatilis TaxID=10195 RepID=A0A3M7QF66_BRAPC|nr:hypothetical protein BpHYR1_048231 [Brachionus plicatilis]